MHLASHLRHLSADARFGVRVFSRSPLYAMVIIAVLACGLGTVYGIVTVATPVLFRPLTFSEPRHLVALDQTAPNGEPVPLSLAELREWTRASKVLVAAGGWDATQHWMQGSTGREQIDGAEVTHDLLTVLRVAPALGRGLLLDDDRPGAEAVVLISDGLWREQFGARRSAIGATLTLSEIPHRIVGVMPPGFRFPAAARYWVAAGRLQEHFDPANRDLWAAARLAPGAGLGAARIEARVTTARLADGFRDRDPQLLLRVRDLRAAIVPRETTTAATLLLAGVALLLLLVVANAAHLAFVRMLHRSKELRTRAALGAAPSRLLVQLIVEAGILVTIAAALAVPLGIALRGLLLGRLAVDIPQALVEFTGPGAVATLALLTALLGATTLLLPVPAALRAAVRADQRSLNAHGSPRRTALVAIQAALAVSLLASSFTAARAMRRLTSIDPGFKPEPVVTALVSFQGREFDRPEVRRQVVRQVLDVVAAVPGVRESGLTLRTPVAGSRIEFAVAAAGQGQASSVAIFNGAAGAYFRAMGIPLLEGRAFDRSDTPENPVAIVSAALARRLWPGQSALGRAMAIGRSRNLIGADDPPCASSVWSQTLGTRAIPIPAPPRASMSHTISFRRTTRRSSRRQIPLGMPRYSAR